MSTTSHQIETVTYTLPACWAPYLINDDDSGLEKGEREEIDEWISDTKMFLKSKIFCPFDVSSNSYFSWHNDANDLGGDVCEFVFLVD